MAFECETCDGKIINASIKEIPSVRITITDTSLKYSPTLPSMKKKVEKAIIVVKTEETTQPQEIEGEVAGETGSKSQAKVDVEEEEINTPRGNDILSGRGAGVQTHPGNMHFRKIIQANKET